ncbi:MAG: type I 3-dehydroquinate dehydratase [Bacteroidetes bacterium]|nr:type I 3-dehydroquinate dehydratase [Bacteroidota bacterium]
MICISIGNKKFEEVKKIINNENFVELRLDKMELTKDEINELFSQDCKLIATYRKKLNITDDERLIALKTAIDSGAYYIDVDINNSVDFINEVIFHVKNKNRKIIISYHNFKETPSENFINTIVDKCYTYKPDIVKVACFVNDILDNSTIFSLYNNFKNIISIGMGEKGKVTRIAGLSLGAPFTYASLNEYEETAPGQIDKTTLLNLFKKMEDLKNKND